MTTKIILQVGQKVNVKKEFVQDIYYKNMGKDVMISLLGHFKNGTLLTDFLSQESSTDKDEDEKLPPDEYVLNEVRKYLEKHLNFFNKETRRPTRTRSEAVFDENKVFIWIQNYIDKLWGGIQERLTHFDADGTTAWSEAPAEGIFSILPTIVDHKTENS